MESRRFEAADAVDVASWPVSPEETRAWCSLDRVDGDVVESWSVPGDVVAVVGTDRGSVVAYGEIWIDDEEHEVELAHVIVRPGDRGSGYGRRFVELLTERARHHHDTVVMRVVPDNEAAIRCYAAAGFQRVTAGEEAAWNAGQPRAYVWMQHRR